jgi:hypothetical protein
VAAPTREKRKDDEMTSDFEELVKARDEIERLKTELRKCYTMVDLVEGTPVQYVGVYVLSWRPEWGRPEVGFVEYEPEDD